LSDRERAEDTSGEDAAWRDLVARFDLPGDPDGMPPPWPAREDLRTARHRQPVIDTETRERSVPGETPESGSADLAEPGNAEPGNAEPGNADGPDRDDDQAAADNPGITETVVVDRARVIRPAAPVQLPADEDDDDDHFIPPPPPPLPTLDPVAKGAWTALFGGPAYLLVATMVGWVIPGWATFGAVAAFVGGFAVVVIRMGDKPSRGSGPDNGAVV
jgi:hypothetical protein